MKYKEISRGRIEAGDIAKVFLKGHPRPIKYIRVDTTPTNNGNFSGHDNHGGKLYHINIYYEVIKAWRATK